MAELDLARGCGESVFNWDSCQRLVSWAAIVFFWGLSICEYLTLSFYQRYR